MGAPLRFSDGSDVVVDLTVDPPRTYPDGPVPFNKPSLEGNELEYLLAAVAQGHTAAGGPFTERVVELLRAELGARDVLLTSSCTDALEAAALLLDLGPDDVVIVPSFTFVSTALAFARTGARIRFADIEPDTLGIDPASVASLLDDDVRVVVPVHYAGVGCDVAGLRSVLAGTNADIVEDNAHGLFASYRGQALGSFGRCSTLSFHETKNFICGEGGALVLNDDNDIDRAHVLLDKGTNRRNFLLGQTDKYSWVDTGSSFGMSDLLAAFLLGQLEVRDTTLAKRRLVAETYASLLEPLEAELGIRCMRVPADRDPAYHMYYVMLPTAELRDHVLQTLVDAGIRATFHYVPLHSSPGAARFSDELRPCPVTDDVSSRLIRLPFFNNLAPSDIERIVDVFVDAVTNSRIRS
jgi:dTDP-4-amino-4,6-dideoxygalactose transaminase